MERELSPEKYLNDEEVGILRRWLRDKSETDLARGREAGPRLRAILETALGTGLRVSELARLDCGHLSLKGPEPCLWVVGSKGRKGTGRNGDDSRDLVYIPRGLVKLLREFLKWKRTKGEPIGEHDPLFASKRGGRYGVRALELGFKKAAGDSGLLARKPQLSIHSLRHTYGLRHYAATKDLRAVQKQLRHKRIATTTIYADVTPAEISRGVDLAYEE